MSARTIIKQLAAQGEIEFFPHPDDPLAQRTFRIKDKLHGYDIGWAVKRLQEKERVCRAGWYGKGVFLTLIQGSDTHQPTVKMKTAQGTFVAWTCSQTDLLARDWELA